MSGSIVEADFKSQYNDNLLPFKKMFNIKKEKEMQLSEPGIMYISPSMLSTSLTFYSRHEYN